MSILDDAKASQGEDDLRAANRRLLRQLDKAKASHEELVDAVYRAARDAASTLVIPPVPAPSKDRRKGKPEVAILLLADWQWGKVTPEYNSDVAAERVALCAAKAVELIELQRSHHPINEARIYLLGDLLEGEEIFPGQSHRIDASLYYQIFRAAEALAGVVRTISASVPSVTVKGVIGNHGALGGPIRRSYHPETNADAILYNIARSYLADEKRVKWYETVTMGERTWYATDDVFDHRWFLFHGDQIKSASLGIPWYGFRTKLLGWATSVTSFTHSASGHWHVPVAFEVNGIEHYGVGSTESANTFAQEYLASGGQRPSQKLLFMGADGITAEYKVRL